MLLYQTLSLIYQESESASFSREEPEGKYFKVCGPDYFCRWLHSSTAVAREKQREMDGLWAVSETWSGHLLTPKSEFEIILHAMLHLLVYSNYHKHKNSL